MPTPLAATTDNKCFVTLLGTGNTFEKRTDDKKLRIGTLDALHIATGASLERETNRQDASGTTIFAKIFDGPDALGSNVHAIIAEVSVYILTKIIVSNVTTIHINGHSRGAVEAIFIANLLHQIKENITKGSVTSFENLLNSCSPKVNLIGSLKKTSTYEELVALCSEDLKARFNRVKVNIFAIDPVPGDDFVDTIPRDVVAWRDPEIFNIPSIVAHYHQLIMEHELSQCFRGLLPIAAHGNGVTKITTETLWGNHCNPCGIPTVQEPMYEHVLMDESSVKVIAPITLDGKVYDTSVVQDLTICLMLNFMQDHSNITDFVTSLIDEKKVHHTKWDDLNLQPLKVIMNDFLERKSGIPSSRKLLAHYERMREAKPVFLGHIAKKTYKTGSRWIIFANDAYPRYMLTKRDQSMVCDYLTGLFANYVQTSDFISLQHYTLYLEDTLHNFSALQILLKTGFSDDIYTLCSQARSFVDFLKASGSSADSKLAKSEEVLLKPILAMMTTHLLESMGAINSFKGIIETFTYVKCKLEAKVFEALSAHVKEIIDQRIATVTTDTITELEDQAGATDTIIQLMMEFSLRYKELNHLLNVMNQLKAHSLHQHSQSVIVVGDKSSETTIEEYVELFKIDDGIAKLLLAKESIENRLLALYQAHQTEFNKIRTVRFAALVPDGECEGEIVLSLRSSQVLKSTNDASSTDEIDAREAGGAGEAIASLASEHSEVIKRELKEGLDTVLELIKSIACVKSLLIYQALDERCKKVYEEKRLAIEAKVKEANLSRSKAEIQVRSACRQRDDANTKLSDVYKALGSAELTIAELRKQADETKNKASLADPAILALRQRTQELEAPTSTIDVETMHVDSYNQTNCKLLQFGLAGTATFGIIGVMALGGVGIAFLCIPGLNIFAIVALGVAAGSALLSVASAGVATIGLFSSNRREEATPLGSTLVAGREAATDH